jgi:hypothetical protein
MQEATTDIEPRTAVVPMTTLIPLIQAAFFPDQVVSQVKELKSLRLWLLHQWNDAVAIGTDSPWAARVVDGDLELWATVDTNCRISLTSWEIRFIVESSDVAQAHFSDLSEPQPRDDFSLILRKHAIGSTIVATLSGNICDLLANDPIIEEYESGEATTEELLGTRKHEETFMRRCLNFIGDNHHIIEASESKRQTTLRRLLGQLMDSRYTD